MTPGFPSFMVISLDNSRVRPFIRGELNRAKFFGSYFRLSEILHSRFQRWVITNRFYAIGDY
jgi:hypothetical protein